MIDRAFIWYIFGLAAVAVILLRWKPTRQANWRDPIAVSFSAGIFFSVLGVLSKLPLLAQVIDATFGPNAAWLLADSFFLIGLWGLTTWIDLMRGPSRMQGRFPIFPGRTIALVLAIAWMVAAAWIEPASWHSLERGGINVGGSWLLLSGRMAYLFYDLWGLSYLGLRFLQLRKQLRERVSYLRLTLAWMAVSLAAIAPGLQLVAVTAVFAWPELLPVMRIPVWQIVSLLQIIVAGLVLTLFFEPAYQMLVRLDKRRLIRRLRHLQNTIATHRPELAARQTQITPSPGQERRQDLILAALVNEIEASFSMMGATSEQLLVSAGRVMSQDLRQELQRQKSQFRMALTQRQPFEGPTVAGDTYVLARWYAHFSAISTPLRQATPAAYQEPI